MQPIGNHVLIRQDTSRKDGVIELLDEPSKPNTGEVISVGTDLGNEFEPGDKVMFKESYTTNVVPGHEDLLVLHVSNIILKL